MHLTCTKLTNFCCFFFFHKTCKHGKTLRVSSGTWAKQTHHQAPLSLQVYDHRYKAFVDGVETDSVMEIDPNHRIMTFRTGNGSKEIVEVHDFKNASTKKSG